MDPDHELHQDVHFTFLAASSQKSKMVKAEKHSNFKDLSAKLMVKNKNREFLTSPLFVTYVRNVPR